MARRCGASFLRKSNLSALVARTHGEYADVAVVLGQSEGKLSEIRQRVERERGEGVLFDTEVWVRGLERMLRMMWDAGAGQEGRPKSRDAPNAWGGNGDRPRSNLVLAGYTGWGD